MNTAILVVIIVILVFIAILAFLLLRRRSSRQMAEREKMAGPTMEELAESEAELEMAGPEMAGPEMAVPEMAGPEMVGARSAGPEKYRISIAHPKFLSKRYSSRFLVQIYLPEMRSKVSRVLAREFKKQEVAELVQGSELETGQRIQIRLSSPDIVFSDPIIKKLDKAVNSTNFIAKPTDDCEPGIHQVVLSLSDAETRVEHWSISFTVKVTDFAFDHVSRPFLSKATSAVLGLVLC
jgi:hypothetical protein